MPAVSPLAATAPAPTSIGGAVSAEPGAFAQALARVEESAKASTKAANTTLAAPAREVETETASTEATPPATVAGADRPVASSEAEATATNESSTTASADDQGETESEALSQDALAQDVTAQDVTAQDVAAQGVTAQGVTAQSATAQGATAEGNSAEGIIAERVTAQGATVQGATVQGATAEGNSAEGVTAERVTAQGATAEGFAAQGAPALVGIPQTPQTVVSQTVALKSVAGTAETAAGSKDLAAPGLNAEQTATSEVGDEVVPASGTADAAGEAVQTAAASAPPPAVAAATTAASSPGLPLPGLPLPGLPLRDPAAGGAPTSRRAEERTAEADGKAASAPRPNGLEGLGVQARATASVAATADGSAATLLSAQMAGQVMGDGQPEQIELAMSAASPATDEAAPLTVAPAPTTVSGAPAGPAAAVHGSQLAASTIETTAQLAAQIARRLEGRSTRFDMALTPDDLGRVDVSLDIDADGGLTARLAFDNPLAATELRGRADELRRQLQDAGFTVGADSLSFSERETGSSNGGSGQRFGQGAERAFIGAGRLTDDLETVAVPPAWISHSQTPQGVDLKV